MSELVYARKQFLSKKFHWCSKFLQDITLLNWLEQADLFYIAIILLSHRRSMSKARTDLPDKVNVSDKLDYRQLRYPLV